MTKILLWGGGLCLFAAAGGYAQTAVDLRTQVRNPDFTGAGYTRPFKTGIILPLQCAPGDTFLKLDAPAGQNLYACLTTDSWSAQGGSLPALAGKADQILSNNGTTAQWRALGGDIGGRPDAVTVTALQGRRVSVGAPGDGSVLRWNQSAGEWEASGSVLTSLFGRTGAVTAQAGDYTFSQIGGTADVSQGGTGATAFANQAILTGGGAGPFQASGCSADANGSLACAGSLSAGTNSHEPGESLLYDAAGVNYYSWLAPNGIPTTTRLRLPATQPAAGQVMVFGTPVGGISDAAFASPLLADTAAILQNKTMDSSTQFSGYSTWSQIPTPVAPAAGALRVYAKTGQGLCWIGADGEESCAGTGQGSVAGATPYTCSVTAASSAACAHNLGTAAPWVACYDSGGTMLGSSGASTSVTSVTATSPSIATIAFSEPTTGTCVISTGSMGPQGPPGPAGPAGSAGDPAGNTGDLQKNGGAGFAVAVAGTDYYRPGSPIASADLPHPAVGAGGKVQSKTCSAGQHVSAINTDSTVSCTADSGGAPAVRYFQIGATDGSSGQGIGQANRPMIFGFYNPTEITFSRILFSVQTADGTNPSSVCIVDGSGNLIAGTTPATYASTGAQDVPIAGGGTATLARDTRYYLSVTSAAVTFKLGSSSGGASMYTDANWINNATTVLSGGNCNVPHSMPALLSTWISARAPFVAFR
jgi:hypothetical protein